MIHCTRRNNAELNKIDMDPSRLIRRARQQSNTPSLPVVGPEGTIEDAAMNVASDDKKGLTFWLDEIHRAATEHTKYDQIDEEKKRKKLEPPEYLPSLDEEDVEIVLRRREVKKIIDAPVANTM